MPKRPHFSPAVSLCYCCDSIKSQCHIHSDYFAIIRQECSARPKRIMCGCHGLSKHEAMWYHFNLFSSFTSTPPPDPIQAAHTPELTRLGVRHLHAHSGVSQSRISGRDKINSLVRHLPHAAPSVFTEPLKLFSSAERHTHPSPFTPPFVPCRTRPLLGLNPENRQPE